MWTTLNCEGRSKTKKKTATDICKGTLDIEFERDWLFSLGATLRDRQKIKKYFSSFKNFFREKPMVSYYWASNVLQTHKI